MENVKVPNESGKRKTRNDIIFIIALLLIFMLFGLLYFLLRKEGDVAVVTIDGEVYAECPLSEDIRLEIKNGDSLNILVIENGRAYVEDASCPDGICVNHRPISKDKESIVCLPNKVVITVRRYADDSPDIIL